METIRVRGGRAPLWPLHLRRLETSCRSLGLPFPAALEEPRGGADRAHRLQVGPTGVMVTERAVGPGRPLRLVTSRLVHRPYPHKTTERELFAAALDEAREAGADDALLLTGRGEVAEAAIWCIFWWEGCRLCTPALDLGVLPSIARSRIEELAGPLTERRMLRGALAGRSIFLGNALRGVVEVAELDGAPVPADPATAAVRRWFWER